MTEELQEANQSSELANRKDIANPFVPGYDRRIWEDRKSYKEAWRTTFFKLLVQMENLQKEMRFT